MNSRDQIAEGWRKYKRLRLQLLIAFFGFIPFGSLTATISYGLFKTPLAAQIALLGWMVFFLIAGVRYNRFRCPRCDKPFSQKGLSNLSYFARKCRHCGLRKLSLGDP
jgi:hypothetical protein